MRQQEPQSTPTSKSGGVQATWVEDHLDAVYRYTRRRIGASLAEDVTQQAFEALFRADAAGRRPDDPGAYLLGTARRRIADVFRRRARRPEPVSLPESWEGLALDLLPPAALESGELVELVHVALGLLPARQRHLIEARYRADLPVQRIAEQLGTTEKAVEARLARARRAFAAQFRCVGQDWIEAEAGALPISQNEEERPS